MSLSTNDNRSRNESGQRPPNTYLPVNDLIHIGQVALLSRHELTLNTLQSAKLQGSLRLPARLRSCPPEYQRWLFSPLKDRLPAFLLILNS